MSPTISEQERFQAAERALQEANRRRAVTRAVKRLERQDVTTKVAAIEMLIALGWRTVGS